MAGLCHQVWQPGIPLKISFKTVPHAVDSIVVLVFLNMLPKFRAGTLITFMTGDVTARFVIITLNTAIL